MRPKKPTKTTVVTPLKEDHTPTFNDRIAALLLYHWPEPVDVERAIHHLYRYASKEKGINKTEFIRSAIEAATPMLVHRLNPNVIAASTANVGNLFTQCMEIAQAINPTTRRATYFDVHSQLKLAHGAIVDKIKLNEFLVDANLEFREGRQDLIVRGDCEDVRGFTRPGFRVTAHGVNFLLEMRGGK